MRTGVCVAVLAAVAVIGAGCTETQKGAAIGAGSGALIGGLVGDGEGALIGAGVGALAGTAAGSQVEKNRLREERDAAREELERERLRNELGDR
jgi:uncharacterized protein YcfJ